MEIGMPVGSNVKPPKRGMSVRNGTGRISRAKIIAAKMARIAMLLESVLNSLFSTPLKGIMLGFALYTPKIKGDCICEYSCDWL